MPSESPKVAVVTGAAGGIGLATAQAFASQGWQVAMVDRDRERLEGAALTIGSDVLTHVADVSEPASAEDYVARIMERFGRIDAAVINAGINGPIAPLETIDVADFDRTYAVNVRGAWLGLRALFPVLKPQGGGSIVMISSVAGVQAAPLCAPYGASKHAVIGLMKAAAAEGARHGIRVNAIAPAPIETDMLTGLMQAVGGNDPDAALRRKLEKVPLRRVGRPEEIAAMALFLCSPGGAYCTGAVYPVDGGQTAI